MEDSENKWILYFSIVGIILTAIFVYIFFRLYKNMKTETTAIKNQIEKDTN